MPEPIKVMIDMDGVLDDFVGGACRAHGRGCYDEPEHLGEFQLEKIWGISAKQFWAPTNNFNFWANLYKTAEADNIINLFASKFGALNCAILTSPSLNKECIPAKRAWLDKHYPGYSKRMICAYDKSFLAGPRRILVDDRDRNIEDFERDGGYGILVPRPWNKRHQNGNNLDSENVFRTIELELSMILEEMNERDNELSSGCVADQ